MEVVHTCTYTIHEDFIASVTDTFRAPTPHHLYLCQVIPRSRNFNVPSQECLLQQIMVENDPNVKTAKPIG